MNFAVGVKLDVRLTSEVHDEQTKDQPDSIGVHAVYGRNGVQEESSAAAAAATAKGSSTATASTG
jgi:hypothetical protein